MVRCFEALLMRHELLQQRQQPQQLVAALRVRHQQQQLL
jgi:hypothetical protein